MRKQILLLLLLFLPAAVSAGCAGGTTRGEYTDVDVDLTLLSSTMAMAKANEMVENSKEYIGKIVRIAGPYYVSYYDETGPFYHYVLIDSCCMGFEFILSGDTFYPDDYPKQMAYIEVTGVFGSYEEQGNTYYYLAADEYKIL